MTDDSMRQCGRCGHRWYMHEEVRSGKPLGRCHRRPACECEAFVEPAVEVHVEEHYGPR